MPQPEASRPEPLPVEDAPVCCVCLKGMLTTPPAAYLIQLRGLWYCEHHDGKSKVKSSVRVQRKRKPAASDATNAARNSHEAPVEVEYPFMLRAGDRVCIDGGMWAEFVGYSDMAVETENELLLLWRVGWLLPLDKERRQVCYRIDGRVVKTRWFTVGEPDAQNFMLVAPYVDTEHARDFFSEVLTAVDSHAIQVASSGQHYIAQHTVPSVYIEEMRLRANKALNAESCADMHSNLVAVALYALLAHKAAWKQQKADDVRSSALRHGQAD